MDNEMTFLKIFRLALDSIGGVIESVDARLEEYKNDLSNCMAEAQESRNVAPFDVNYDRNKIVKLKDATETYLKWNDRLAMLVKMSEQMTEQINSMHPDFSNRSATILKNSFEHIWGDTDQNSSTYKSVRGILQMLELLCERVVSVDKF